VSSEAPGGSGGGASSRPPSDGSDERPPLGVFTLANLITLLRLLTLPVFLWLLFTEENRGGAAAVLALAGATDFVDGYVARHFGQGSEFGKVFDPVADRLLFFVGISAILADGSAPRWFCILVLIREVLVASATVGLAVAGAPRIDVTWYGKAGTFGLMFAFPLFLAGHSDLGLADTFEALAWIAGVPGLVLSYYAAALYVPMARRALAQRGEPGGTGGDQGIGG
jgi:cardiolipin synthase (CMP-forming)